MSALILIVTAVILAVYLFSVLCKIAISAYFEVKNYYHNKKGVQDGSIRRNTERKK